MGAPDSRSGQGRAGRFYLGSNIYTLSFECWAWGKGGGEEAGKDPRLTFGCLLFDKDDLTIDKTTQPLITGVMGCSRASASF